MTLQVATVARGTPGDPSHDVEVPDSFRVVRPSTGNSDFSQRDFCADLWSSPVSTRQTSTCSGEWTTRFAGQAGRVSRPSPRGTALCGEAGVCGQVSASPSSAMRGRPDALRPERRDSH